jgi:putative hydrolase of the HAD superfamily
VSTLQAILFDIDDTLYSTTEFAEQARRNSIQAMIDNGLDIDFETAFRELKEVISEFKSNYDRHYDKLLRRLPWKALGGVNPALLVAAGVVAYHETKFRQLRPFRDAEEALRRLSENTTLILGILTEGLEIKQAEKLIRLGVVKYLDPRALFISDQVGISKPNPKLYRYALDRLGLPAEDVMYVGDNPERDIHPAREVGLITVRYRGSGKYAKVTCDPPPDHEINDFHDLLALLEAEYGIRC